MPPLEVVGFDERSLRLFRVLISLRTIPEPWPPGANSPDVFAEKGRGIEDLVVEFDDAYTAFVEGIEALPSEVQMTALQRVDTKLSAMVDAKDAALWSERARREDPHWIEVGELAADVIEQFSWPSDVAGEPIN
ncbi:MAG: hypothetical protein VCB25_11375 [Myxococcota bacterium]